MANTIKWNYEKADAMTASINTKANDISISTVDYPAGVVLLGAGRAHEYYCKMCNLTERYKSALQAEATNISSCNETLKSTDESLGGH